MSKKEGATQLDVLGRYVTFLLSPNTPEVFTVSEAAKCIGTNPKTLKQLLVIGNEFQHTLPPYKIVKDKPLTLRKLSSDDVSQNEWKKRLETRFKRLEEKLGLIAEGW